MQSSSTHDFAVPYIFLHFYASYEQGKYLYFATGCVLRHATRCFIKMSLNPQPSILTWRPQKILRWEDHYDRLT
jgi:hypothetical protein